MILWIVRMSFIEPEGVKFIGFMGISRMPGPRDVLDQIGHNVDGRDGLNVQTRTLDNTSRL